MPFRLIVVQTPAYGIATPVWASLSITIRWKLVCLVGLTTRSVPEPAQITNSAGVVVRAWICMPGIHVMPARRAIRRWSFGRTLPPPFD